MQRFTVSQQYPGIASPQLEFKLGGQYSRLSDSVNAHMIAAAETNVAQLPTLMETVSYSDAETISDGEKLTEKIGNGTDSIEVIGTFSDTKGTLARPIAQQVIRNALLSVEAHAQSGISGIPVTTDPYQQVFARHAVETRAQFRQDQLRQDRDNTPLSESLAGAGSSRSSR